MSIERGPENNDPSGEDLSEFAHEIQDQTALNNLEEVLRKQTDPNFVADHNDGFDDKFLRRLRFVKSQLGAAWLDESGTRDTPSPDTEIIGPNSSAKTSLIEEQRLNFAKYLHDTGRIRK